MRHSTTARGITLLELMIVVAIIGIMGAISVVKMVEVMPANRTRAAARKVLMDLRSAPSLAARTNLALTVTFDLNDANCPPTSGGLNQRAGYTGRTTNPATGEIREYFKTCLGREFGGVGIAAVGPGGPLVCAGTEVATAGAAAASACTLCGAGAPVVLTYFPTGELAVAAPFSLTLVPERDVVGGPVIAHRSMAIGVAPLTGRARIYQTNVAGTGWECP